MADKKIPPANMSMKNSVILRLVGNALLSLWTAMAYSDTSENLIRIGTGDAYLPIIVAVLFVDTALTILWLKSYVVYSLHLGAYILLYGIGYLLFIVDTMNLQGIAAIVAVMFAPVLWVIGLIPFIICGSGRKRLKRALAEEQQL